MKYYLLDCNNIAARTLLSIIKNAVNIIWIIGPILAIVSLTYKIFLYVKNPEDKKIPSKIKNSVIALFILFFIPMFVNVVMNLLGDKNQFAACWNQNVSKKINTSTTYQNTSSDSKKKATVFESSDYEKGKKRTNNGQVIPNSNCGNLEYCNKYITSMYTNSQKLDEAFKSGHGTVEYSQNSPHSWEEAIQIVSNGGLLKLSCNRPSHWGMRDITGEYRDFWSNNAGGFINYAGPMTEYTTELKFDGSKTVKQAIQEGMIQTGDIIGTTVHTFTIYKTNSDGSALVFDGGHRYVSRCQNSKQCSPLFEYSASENAGLPLYQIIRWIK